MVPRFSQPKSPPTFGAPGRGLRRVKFKVYTTSVEYSICDKNYFVGVGSFFASDEIYITFIKFPLDLGRDLLAFVGFSPSSPSGTPPTSSRAPLTSTDKARDGGPNKHTQAYEPVPEEALAVTQELLRIKPGGSASTSASPTSTPSRMPSLESPR